MIVKKSSRWTKAPPATFPLTAPKLLSHGRRSMALDLALEIPAQQHPSSGSQARIHRALRLPSPLASPPWAAHRYSVGTSRRIRSHLGQDLVRRKLQPQQAIRSLLVGMILRRQRRIVAHPLPVVAADFRLRHPRRLRARAGSRLVRLQLLATQIHSASRLRTRHPVALPRLRNLEAHSLLAPLHRLQHLHFHLAAHSQHRPPRIRLRFLRMGRLQPLELQRARSEVGLKLHHHSAPLLHQVEAHCLQWEQHRPLDHDQ